MGGARADVTALCLAEVNDLMEAWDETPPQAVSLHWIRNMVAGYFGIDTGDGPKAKPLPVTPEVVDWMQRELANMSGGASQEVFRAVQEMEVTDER